MSSQSVNSQSVNEDRDNTYLVFRLMEERYLVPVVCVEEVLEFEPPTFVPRTPEYLLGIINVRGRLIPILDLRRRFALPRAEATPDSRFVVLKLSWNGESVPLGILADAVEGVVDLPPESIAGPPAVGRSGENEFILGTARLDAQILMVLDVDQVLTSEYLHRSFDESTG